MTVIDHEPVSPASTGWSWDRTLPITAPAVTAVPARPVGGQRVLPARTLWAAALITLLFLVLIVVVP